MTFTETPTTEYDCIDLRAMLSALLDGQLAEDHRFRVERHLAQCSGCRTMLDEAEAANDALALMARGEDELPAGFESIVLSQTRPEPLAPAAHRSPGVEILTTWGGWLAAAAALMLAVTIWMLDRSVPTPVNNERIVATDVGPAEGDFRQAHLARSFTFNADTPDFQMPQVATPRVAGISRNDAETLHAVGDLLEDLEQPNADLEWVNDVLSYDELCPRISQIRVRLGDREPMLFAAESILRELERSAEPDVAFLREQIRTLNLIEALRTLGDQWVAGSA